MTDTVNVPREPTEAMIEAGNQALSPWVAPAMHAAEAYRAMLAAAPKGEAVSDPYKLVTASDLIAWVDKHQYPTSWVATREDIKSIVEQIAAQPLSNPQQLEMASVGWTAPSEVPETKKGEHSYRIVAVKRAGQGGKDRTAVFSAFYMNDVPLWFEDDNESRNVTGWHSDTESDDGPTYSPLLGDGDTLLGWCDFPKWDERAQPEAQKGEPVAWRFKGAYSSKWSFSERKPDAEWKDHIQPLYTHPAPSSELLEALEPFASIASVMEARDRMALGKVRSDDEIIAEISWEGGMGVLVMGHLRDALAMVPNPKGWGGLYRPHKSRLAKHKGPQS